MTTKIRLTIAACGLAIFTLSPAVSQAEDYTYLTNNGTITITGYTGPGGDVVIPDTINGLPVTSIWVAAFYYNPGLTSITIPNCITNIGDNAFEGCFQLTNITSGDGVTHIGDWALAGCGSLTSVTLPSSLASIGEFAFSGCQSLTNLTIGNSLVSIGDYAFQFCTSLTSLTLPSSLATIGEGAFTWCSELAEITVDPLNTVYSSSEGVLLNGSRTTVLLCPWGKAGGYVIPDGVTNIADSAFAYCGRMSSVTIPDSVISIGNWIFNQCSSLTSVMIPNSVISIGDGAFHGCSSLTSVTIPDSVNSIANWVFTQCPSLNTVSIGDGVTSIGESAFSGCQSLSNLTIGNSLASIGDYAFQGCTSLTSLTLPSSLASIGEGAFSYCMSLMAVYFLGDAPNPATSAFNGDPGATVYYLPGTSGWSSTFAGRPTAPWLLPNPLILTSNSGFGVGANGFGFIISWATNASVVVEASTSLANPIWSPVRTNTLSEGWSYFSDSQWTNYTRRFYRLQVP